MGSMTWEEMGRELGPISLTVTVFFREAFPKRDTWAGLLSLALEPRGLLVLEPHQEALPTQPGSHQIREGCNGTNWLLLKKKTTGAHQHCRQIWSWRLEARKIVQGRMMSFGRSEDK